MSYKVRVHLANLDRQKLLTYLFSKSNTYCYSFEKDASREHIQLYMRLNPKNLPAIRAHIRKLTGGGNGGYSIKECNDDVPIDYMAYLLKEENWIEKKQYLDIPDDIIKQVQDHNEKVKSEMKEKKSSKTTVLQKLINILENKSINYELSIDDIISEVISYYEVSGSLVREFAMVSQVQTLALKFVPHYKNLLHERILDKISAPYKK